MKPLTGRLAVLSYCIKRNWKVFFSMIKRDFDGSIKSEKNIFFSDIIFSKNGNANYLGRCQAYPSFKLEESIKVLILAQL